MVELCGLAGPFLPSSATSRSHHRVRTREIAGMVAYTTHDQASPDNRRPTTSERVAWSACLGIPTKDTDLMVRAMQGLTADAPALNALAGISARGRKLRKPYTHTSR